MKAQDKPGKPPVELRDIDLDKAAGGRKAGEGQKDWLLPPPPPPPPPKEGFYPIACAASAFLRIGGQGR